MNCTLIALRDFIASYQGHIGADAVRTFLEDVSVAGSINPRQRDSTNPGVRGGMTTPVGAMEMISHIDPKRARSAVRSVYLRADAQCFELKLKRNEDGGLDFTSATLRTVESGFIRETNWTKALFATVWNVGTQGGIPFSGYDDVEPDQKLADAIANGSAPKYRNSLETFLNTASFSDGSFTTRNGLFVEIADHFLDGGQETFIIRHAGETYRLDVSTTEDGSYSTDEAQFYLASKETLTVQHFTPTSETVPVSA